MSHVVARPLHPFKHTLINKIGQRFAQRPHRDIQISRHIPFRRQTRAIGQMASGDFTDQHLTYLHVFWQRIGAKILRHVIAPRPVRAKIDTQLICINVWIAQD